MSDGPGGLKIERAMAQTGIADAQKALKKFEKQNQVKQLAPAMEQKSSPKPNLPMPEEYSKKSSSSNMLSLLTNPTSNNKNRDYSQKAKVLEVADSAEADLGNGPGTQAGDERACNKDVPEGSERVTRQTGRNQGAPAEKQGPNSHEIL